MGGIFSPTLSQKRYRAPLSYPFSSVEILLEFTLSNWMTSFKGCSCMSHLHSITHRCLGLPVTFKDQASWSLSRQTCRTAKLTVPGYKAAFFSETLEVSLSYLWTRTFMLEKFTQDFDQFSSRGLFFLLHYLTHKVLGGGEGDVGLLKTFQCKTID